ncbi:6-carboxy-5,6,7,8-tetrahydropterin synthase [Bradyrhizobium centrolobii]|uniref:6-carboxy-5,6,7,8-tetrahydropterin synthase n=1 Tax=Bradyrhizobium centrolobii TaxID=1505087 RepID=A0A176YKE1_9BRAD|nr:MULTISPECIES: 6-carboxytetrahydropterin synthase QueD [Bradyrhizobium]OAF06916.1 6-carboxy-5,6,7,8-tetrahydropterin synthase [Bradyrhizobium centrolobii]
MKISQAFKFRAAHRLPNVPSTHGCSRVHGHSYRVEVYLEGPVDPVNGIVADFSAIDESIVGIMTTLDHRYLNEVQGLENPTAERIAEWIWERLNDGLPRMSSVRVYETADCWAEYDGR